jgi:hypothetical protein
LGIGYSLIKELIQIPKVLEYWPDYASIPPHLGYSDEFIKRLSESVGDRHTTRIAQDRKIRRKYKN